MLISKTPLRISFFGGGTDYPAYCSNQSGYVFGSTINYHIYILLKKLEFFDDYKYKISYSKLEKKNYLKDINHNLIKNILKKFGYKNIPLEINIVSDVPAKTGLGSSSSFTVGLINGLYKMDNKKISKKNLRNESINLERKYSDKYIGFQDQTFAAYGGFNLIKFDDMNFTIKKVTRVRSVKDLEKNLLLIYLDSRSKINLTKSLSEKIDDGMNKKYLKELAIIAQESFKIFNSSTFNIKEFGYLLNESWKLKKLSNNEISNYKVDSLITELLELGAYGAKLFGAGNSGFIGTICNDKVKKKVKQKFKNKCYEIKFTNTGSIISDLSFLKYEK